MKAGPNSSVSVKKKGKKAEDDWEVHNRSATRFYSPITLKLPREREDVQHHAAIQL